MEKTSLLPEGGLLQSRLWADFLALKRKKVLTISSGGAQVFGSVEKLPFVGRYLYVPRLSICDEALLRAIVEQAQTAKCRWVRADLSDKVSVEKITAMYPVAGAPHDMQPRENFVIDISPSREDLLAGMKSKTRYNVRLAEKKGVEISSYRYDDEGFRAAFKSFIGLVGATGKRKGVSFHNRGHYEKMFKSLPHEKVSLYAARYEGEVIAANIVTFYGDVGTYLHGASGEKHRNVMAPFLLQWQAILDAKERDCTHYDFTGYYSETDDPGKAGISRFKKSFSPVTEPLATAGSYDIVLAPIWYFLYRVIQKVRSFF